MLVAGIACKRDKGRAVVRVVVLERTNGDWNEVRKFEHKCDAQHPIAQQLADLTDDLHQKLDKLDLDSVVVRDRDDIRQKVRVDYLNTKFTADGVALAVAGRRCRTTQYANGKAIGDLCGSSKDATENEAQQRFGKGYEEAGAAALAATTLG